MHIYGIDTHKRPTLCIVCLCYRYLSTLSRKYIHVWNNYYIDKVLLIFCSWPPRKLDQILAWITAVYAWTYISIWSIAPLLIHWYKRCFSWPKSIFHCNCVAEKYFPFNVVMAEKYFATMVGNVVPLYTWPQYSFRPWPNSIFILYTWPEIL